MCRSRRRQEQKDHAFTVSRILLLIQWSETAADAMDDPPSHQF